jgi:hypothetical protein
MKKFKKTIVKTWDAIKDKTCEMMVDGFGKRLEAIIDADGAHTRY